MQQCTLLYLRRQHDVLLAMKKRGFGVGNWNGVGGKVEPGESIEANAIRECIEEIGVAPRKLYKVAILKFINNFSQKPSERQVETHVYMSDHWEGEPKESEEMAPRWFHIQEIPYQSMWEDDPLWLPLSLTGKKLRGTFIFADDATMLSAHIDIVKDLLEVET